MSNLCGLLYRTTVLQKPPYAAAASVSGFVAQKEEQQFGRSKVERHVNCNMNKSEKVRTPVVGGAKRHDQVRLPRAVGCSVNSHGRRGYHLPIQSAILRNP